MQCEALIDLDLPDHGGDGPRPDHHQPAVHPLGQRAGRQRGTPDYPSRSPSGPGLRVQAKQLRLSQIVRGKSEVGSSPADDRLYDARGDLNTDAGLTGYGGGV